MALAQLFGRGVASASDGRQGRARIMRRTVSWRIQPTSMALRMVSPRRMRCRQVENGIAEGLRAPPRLVIDAGGQHHGGHRRSRRWFPATRKDMVSGPIADDPATASVLMPTRTQSVGSTDKQPGRDQGQQHCGEQLAGQGADEEGGEEEAAAGGRSPRETTEASRLQPDQGRPGSRCRQLGGGRSMASAPMARAASTWGVIRARR